MFLCQRLDVLCSFLELFFLVVIDVRPLALGEPIYEGRFGTLPEEDDRPLAFRSSLPWSGDPLFDDFTTKISVDLALVGTIRSITRGRIRNSFLLG